MTEETHNALLGKSATDKINGFAGTVTGIAFYLTGCTQYLIEGKVHNGETRTLWTDDERVVFEDETQVVSGKDGGPQHNAPLIHRSR